MAKDKTQWGTHVHDDGSCPFLQHFPGIAQEPVKAFAGKDIVISITEAEAKRRVEANNYYWLVLEIIDACTGEDKYRLHAIFKSMFLKNNLGAFNGQEVYEIKSTRDLSIRKFYQYVESVRDYAFHELDIVTPDPDKSLKSR